MFFNYIRFFFYLFLAWVIFFISIKFRTAIGEDIVMYLLFPVVFLLINYAFLKLTLRYVNYYNNLIILHKRQIIVIKSSFLDLDNIEIIDMHKITKLDTFCKGFVANIIGYGTLVIEQQRDQVRDFWYIPEPYKAINLLKEANRDIQEKGLVSS